MSEFLSLTPLDVARERLLNHLHPIIDFERVDTIASWGRINAVDILAPHPLPEFARATVDGYALRAKDTYGASDSLPAYFQVIGNVRMGVQPDFQIEAGLCASIHTGGMLPSGANAVVMIEHTQFLGATQISRLSEIEVFKSIAVNENVIPVGEDVKTGEVVIKAGQELRAPEIGGLMALGITQLLVTRQPVIGIISSGDEIVPPENQPAHGQVRDVNMSLLSVLLEQAGARAVNCGIIPDQKALLEAAARQALNLYDILIITAGSSVSARDFTGAVIDNLGKPGILVHGVNVHPGKPTILAVCDGKPVFGLPGNPVSALVIARLFVIPVIKLFSGEKKEQPISSVAARLMTNIPSQTGREDWVPIRLYLSDDNSGWFAEPVYGKSNLIITLVRSDGLVQIPSSAGGLHAGDIVQVYLL